MKWQRLKKSQGKSQTELKGTHRGTDAGIDQSDNRDKCIDTIFLIDKYFFLTPCENKEFGGKCQLFSFSSNVVHIPHLQSI